MHRVFLFSTITLTLFFLFFFASAARKAEADMTLGEKYVRERKLKKRLKKKAVSCRPRLSTNGPLLCGHANQRLCVLTA